MKSFILKKNVSLLLTVVMLLSYGAGVFAADEEDQLPDDVSGTEAAVDFTEETTENDAAISESVYPDDVDADTDIDQIEETPAEAQVEEVDSSAVLSSDGTGWRKIGKYWYYYLTSTQMVTGTRRYIDNVYYSFDEDGRMQTGWFHPADGYDYTWCYAKSDGALVSGWQYIGKKWYYFANSSYCEMVYNSTYTIDGKTYFFGENGAMKTGWVKLNNYWYYFNGSGVMQTGWQQIKSKWYYFDGYGRMQSKGAYPISGKYYYFNENGVMQSGGWIKADYSGNIYYYYANSSGVLYTNKWLKSGGKWYYFYGDGIMCTSSVTLDGTTYYFNSDGSCINP